MKYPETKPKWNKLKRKCALRSPSANHWPHTRIHLSVKQIPNIELSANSWLFKSYGIKCKKNQITSNYLD